MVRSPGFEPGSSAWEADVLAKLDYDRQSILQQTSVRKADINLVQQAKMKKRRKRKLTWTLSSVHL